MCTEQPIWQHIVLTAYGAWLYGDLRGFRTRHHREHVEGDYKNPPPPEQYAERERRSKREMMHRPASFPPRLRPVIGEALRERLERNGAMVICIAVANRHVHLLAKLPRTQSRAWTGAAKMHAWHQAKKHGWSRKLWGIRSKTLRIKNRAHQLAAFRYILAHAEEGAWVWRWTKGYEPRG
ncbi:MAG: hypothetical protein JSS27_01745 [Planctomycetes bacterium]|nr:hypothetical protein [Planctomycetota bacterium]